MIMNSGLTTSLGSQLKLQPIKLKELLMEAWRKREKVFTVQDLVKKELSLLMILICHKKRSMVLNHQLSSSDNGWTMADGMILIYQKENSESL